MERYNGWEVIEPPLGEGGQSTVYKVRTPARVAERTKCRESFRYLLDRNRMDEFADAVWSYTRPDSTSELGALKVFKISVKGATLPPLPESEDHEAVERLKNETTVLGQNRPGLPRLLDSNADDRWIVTELFPEGTLERHFSKYQGKGISALRAFRSLVATVAALHKDNYVHRDIKPVNVFVRKDDELILGDFGIVYMPSAGERLTRTKEKVGPRDYMPQWADLGERLEDVKPNFDVYMLEKLLWCMTAGRLKLPREYHRRPEFDLTAMFPNNEIMKLINDSVLDRCVVEEPGQWLTSAKELLEVVDQVLDSAERKLPMRDRRGKITLPCRMCGRGFYEADALGGTVRLPVNEQAGWSANPILVRVFVCNVCTHYEFFAPGMPDEAAARGWAPWRQLKT